MIKEAQYIYYITYAVLFVIIGICYLKLKSSEPLTITTKEFKQFQTLFLNGYIIMILGELIAIGSFYQTMILLDLSIAQVARLYIVTVIPRRLVKPNI